MAWNWWVQLRLVSLGHVLCPQGWVRGHVGWWGRTRPRGSVSSLAGLLAAALGMGEESTVQGDGHMFSNLEKYEIQLEQESRNLHPHPAWPLASCRMWQILSGLNSMVDSGAKQKNVRIITLPLTILWPWCITLWASVFSSVKWQKYHYPLHRFFWGLMIVHVYSIV